MRNKNCIMILILVSWAVFLCAQTKPEKTDFSKIEELYKIKKFPEVYKLTRQYLDKYPAGYYTADAYFYLALLEKSYYSAIIIYQDLIDKFPAYTRREEAVYRLAKLYFLHNNSTEAVHTFEKVITEYKNGAYFYGSNYYLGVLQLIRNNPTAAEKYFDYVISQNKKDRFHSLAVSGKANIFYEKQDYEKSIYYNKEGLQLNSVNEKPGFYLGLGNSYMKLKNYEKAYYYYKLILKDFSGSSEYEVALEKINFMNDNKTILDQINFDKIKMDRPKKETPKKEEYYTIQIASVKNQRYANDWRVRLKTQGYDSFYKKFDSGQGNVYKTFVGKYKTMAEAEKDKKQIEEKYKLNCLVIKIE